MGAIHDAARQGNIAALEHALAAGEHIDDRANFGPEAEPVFTHLTPLMMAAGSIEGATVDTLRWLVDHGADITAVSGNGVTAAWFAAGRGFAEPGQGPATTTDAAARLRFLLAASQGLELHYPPEGTELLIQAAQAGDPDRVQVLIDLGVSVHPAGPSYGDGPWREAIPLFCAVEADCLGCVELILAAGADPNVRDYSHSTPIMGAPNGQIFRALLAAGADPTLTNRYGRDLLDCLISLPQLGDVPPTVLTEDMTALGFDVNAVVQYDTWTRLFTASFALDSLGVERLLLMGANVHQGRPPLSGFCWHYNATFSPDIVRGMDLLVEAGCNVNARDGAGDTLLHNAAMGYSHCPSEDCFNSSSDGCNLTAVVTLLNHGADPDPAGAKGYTPLMYAEAAGCTPVLKALLAAGADPKRRNQEGTTAIDLAKAALAYDPSQEAIACLEALLGKPVSKTLTHQSKRRRSP